MRIATQFPWNQSVVEPTEEQLQEFIGKPFKDQNNKVIGKTIEAKFVEGKVHLIHEIEKEYENTALELLKPVLKNFSVKGSVITDKKKGAIPHLPNTHFSEVSQAFPSGSMVDETRNCFMNYLSLLQPEDQGNHLIKLLTNLGEQINNEDLKRIMAMLEKYIVKEADKDSSWSKDMRIGSLEPQKDFELFLTKSNNTKHLESLRNFITNMLDWTSQGELEEIYGKLYEAFYKYFEDLEKMENQS